MWDSEGLDKMILRDLYAKLWGHDFLNRVDVDDRKALYQQTLGYIFRFVGADDFAKQLLKFNKRLGGEYTNSELRTWARENFLYRGYVIRNLKFFLFAVSTRIDKTPEECRKRFGVRECDENLHILIKDDWSDQFKAWAKKHVEINLYSLAAYDNLLERVWFTNMEFVAKFAWRKLKFISNSTGKDVADIQRDLMTEGLRAVNHMWPDLRSEAHVHSLFKLAAKNEGKNMIEKATTVKHARLVATTGGYEQLTVDFDAVVNSKNIADQLSTDLRQHPELKADIALFVDTLSPKKRMLIESLSGRQNDFSVWLAENDLIRPTQDNEDLLDRLGLKKYMKVVCEWLKVEYENAHAFMQQVQGHFSAYRGMAM